MNERDIIDKDNESVIAFMRALDSILDSMESAFSNYKPFLDGERFLTDEEVSKLLHISRRTLQDYRTQGKIPYYQFGGKVLYKESELEEILKEGYQEAFNM